MGLIRLLLGMTPQEARESQNSNNNFLEKRRIEFNGSTLELNNNIVNLTNRLYDNYIGLASGTDLNNIKAVGIYATNSNTQSQSLINCPTAMMFKMKVSNSCSIVLNSSSIYVSQTIINYDSGEKYYRNFNGTVWSSWTKTSPLAIGRAESSIIYGANIIRLDNQIVQTWYTNGILDSNSSILVTMPATAYSSANYCIQLTPAYSTDPAPSYSVAQLTATGFRAWFYDRNGVSMAGKSQAFYVTTTGWA